MAFKIYTKTGDKGETALFGGKRLPKSDPRIEAYGTVDELNSWMGLLGAAMEPAEQKSQLQEIQNRLFTIGSMLAADPSKQLNIPTLSESHIHFLEGAIDAMEQTLPPLKSFILPGGHPLVAQCHIARCVCRRAERRVVALSAAEAVSPLVVQYLNRLSDYLFVLSRFIGQGLGAPEIPWTAGD